MCILYIYIYDISDDEVRSGVNRVLAKIVAWSLRCAAQGTFPAQGYYGETFSPHASRSKLVGKQIAGGFKHLV